MRTIATLPIGVAVALITGTGCIAAHRDYGDDDGEPSQPTWQSIVPSNHEAFGRLASITGNENRDLAGGTFDTSTDCAPETQLGQCSVVARAGLPDACVCRSNSLEIINLDVIGSRALVLLVRDYASIHLLDVSGRPGIQGPGASAAYDDSHGFGGAGGSFGGEGAPGWAEDAPPSAASYGNPSLIPLIGGMMGQQGHLAGHNGGGGGGALQITAGGSIYVLGAITSGGGGGNGGLSSWTTSGAGGGGSGGGILLEAPSVVISGTVAANGGGGGGGGGGSRDPEAGQNGVRGGSNGIEGWGRGGRGNGGGVCADLREAYGGPGGDGAIGMDDSATPVSTAPTRGWPARYLDGCDGDQFGGAGGSGGGVGRIRINTELGCQCPGRISPEPTYGALVRER